jgi:hypothetical protein
MAKRIADGQGSPVSQTQCSWPLELEVQVDQPTNKDLTNVHLSVDIGAPGCTPKWETGETQSGTKGAQWSLCGIDKSYFGCDDVLKIKDTAWKKRDDGGWERWFRCWYPSHQFTFL